MLHFFRKFQKYIFIIITVVIVISFSFFGTYSNMQSREQKDKIAFKSVDGTKIYQSELNQFIQFLSTDSEDKRNWGGVWGPNFFNDGVIKKDFIETGMINILAKLFSNQVSKDFQERLIKEKKYKLYSHPQAKFLNTEGIWKFTNPNMAINFSKLKSSDDAMSDDALNARTQLFLNERQFPANFLRYMLLMQEKQYNWLEHDSSLDYSDLSLFGYHKVEDWFGTNLMHLMAEFIINSASIAKQKGYEISREETLADLKRNAIISFKQNEKSPHLNASNVDEYMKEQLRILNLDENGAIKIWNQVLLFRRLFNDMGKSLFLDVLTFKTFDQFASEGFKGTLYQLPDEFKFHDSKSLAKFETYLDCISNRPKTAKEKLNLPTTFKNVSEVQKTSPELVQKRYYVEIAEVSKKDLQSKVTLKEMWKWQLDDKNWELLEHEFPELSLSKANNNKERKKILENLDDTTKSRINKFSRNEIIELHPDWISYALEHAPTKKIVLNIPLKGGKIHIKGDVNRSELLTLLDSQKDDKEKDPLYQYSVDNQNFYRIKVLDRSSNNEIMTYSEANALGSLDDLVDSKLKKFYETNRSKHPEIYQNSDKSWKNFNDVTDSVIGEYYGDFIKALGEDYVSSMIPKDEDKDLTLSRASSLRFIKHASNYKSNIVTNHEENIADEFTEDDSLPPRKPLEKQWGFIAKPYEIKRNSDNPQVSFSEIAHLKVGDWSKIYTPVNGDLYFFHIDEKIEAIDSELLANQIFKGQEKIGYDAECALCASLASEMKNMGSLTLNFLYNDENLTPTENNPISDESNE